MRPARAFLAWLCVSASLSATLQADDFRIETKVFAGKGKEKVSENVTLFQAGYVYDYLTSPDRVAVFDKPHGRFILLDPSRKMKTEIKTDDVLTFTNKLQELAAKNTSSFMRFAADPKFEIEFTADGKLKLDSRFISYHLQTEPAQTPEAAQQYREFSDWYARFNAMTNPPGSTPPFPRLAVNDALAERGLVPTEVQLTINNQPSLGSRGVTMHSEHHVSWRLLQKDIERIAETANQLAVFRKVELAELRDKMKR